MKEPYVYASISITKEKLNELITRICEIKELVITPQKNCTDKKISLRLKPVRSPAFAFYWTYEVEATVLPEGVMVMIAARPHNHFICLPDERLRQSQHIMDLINSMLMLQDGQNTSGLHSTL